MQLQHIERRDSLNTKSNKKPRYEVFEKCLKANSIKSGRVANDLGFGRTVLHDWKTGKSAPKTYKLILIAEYFGVDIKDFFEEE